MEEIYWITRLDSISNVLVLLTIISGLIAAVMTIVWLDYNALAKSGVQKELNESWSKIGKNFVTVCFPLFLVCLLGNTFVPTTKEAYIIYGVGGTIDFIKSDQTTKQLPHKVVIAVDKYLEGLVSDDDDAPSKKRSRDEEDY